MAVQSFLRDLDGLFNYSTDENPTSQQDYQEAVKNWVDTIKSLVDCTLWQPDTEYSVGNVLRTPSLPYELQLTCITAGTSGSAEPDYTDVSLGDTITDGTVTWVVEGYLPLSGGTMTGPIVSNGIALKNEADDSYTEILAGTDETSSYISLYGKSHASSPGRINIRAYDGTNSKYLVLLPNGEFTWNSNTIMTHGVVNGHGIQSGRINCGSVPAGGNITGTISFSTPFSGTPNVVCVQSNDISLLYHCVGDISSTGFRWRINSARSGATTATIDWIAIY